jgi:hypothetical protein
VKRRRGRGGRLNLDGHLRVINAREVARTGRLVLFRSERERVRVHTRRRRTSVVAVRLHLVEVLTALRLHAVLAVEDELELFERTDGTRRGHRTIFGPLGLGARIAQVVERGTRGVGHRHERVGGRDGGRFGFEDDRFLRQVGGEVPQGRVGHGAVVHGEHEFLDRVVEGEAHLLRVTRFNRVDASVLHLFDEVFVGLLREAAAFLGVEEVVVGPALERGAIGVVGEFRGEVNVDAHFVVLERDERQRQARVAVEPEDERQVDGTVLGVGRHLGVVSLLGFGVVQVVVQTPPLLEVAVDALTTDGDFDVLDGAFRGVDGRRTLGGRAEARLRLHFEVHVLDQITVTGDRHGHATIVSGGTVNGLLDDFGREVAVTLVNGLEEGNLRVRSQVNVLRTVRDELHETTGHCESCLYYTLRKKFALEHAVKRVVSFLSLGYIMSQPEEEPEITESESESEREEDELLEDDDDVEMDMDDDFDMGPGGSEEILASTLATPEGDTVCTALLHIGDQLEMQNKILIKILSKLT